MRAVKVAGEILLSTKPTYGGPQAKCKTMELDLKEAESY